MHSVHFDDGLRIHYNGDYSGDVILTKKESNDEITTSFENLLAFVAMYVREKKISQIEQMTDEQLLDLIWYDMGTLNNESWYG